MFRLNKHRLDRLGERAEFKFSNMQAFKVPKGWDKLFVSVISVETGKTIAKSSKATVRSGTCQWTESLSESISISQDSGRKDPEDHFFKFIISMGSGKPGVLGEVVLNLADHIGSSDSTPLTLPLSKCGFGTILQVKIQFLDSKPRFREGNISSSTSSRLGSKNASNNDMDNKPDISENTNNGSVGSFSSSRIVTDGHPDGPINRDAVSLASSSHSSSDSRESSIGRTQFSPKNSVYGSSHTGRQDSAGSHASATSSAGRVDDLSRSNQSSFNSRASGSSTPHQWQEATMQAASHGNPVLSLVTSGSAKELLEVAEETIDELRDEAKMWERHSQKLKIDLEKLKRDCSFKSKQQVELDLELSAANSERDALRREVDLLKSSLEELRGSLANEETCKTEGILQAQKQLEDEIKFLTESNSTLTMQLNKSQEANVELVAILEELEETVEKQRVELASLTRSSSSSENGAGMRDQMLLDVETEWASKLSAKEEEISKLEQSLYKLQISPHPEEMALNQVNPDLVQEIEYLRAKVEELESDCTELTEENLDLIYKLKESRKDVTEAKEFSSFSFNDNYEPSLPESSQSDLSQLKTQICHLEDELRKRDMNGVFSKEQCTLQMDELKKRCSEPEIEIQSFDHSSNPDRELRGCKVKVEEKMSHANELQQKLKHFEATEFDYCCAATVLCSETTNSAINFEMPNILDNIDKQAKLALDHIRMLNNGHSIIAENCNKISTDVMVSGRIDVATQQRLLEDILIDIVTLNSSLQVKIAGCKKFFQNIGEGIRERIFTTATNVNILEDDIINERNNDFLKELKSRNEELEASFLLKEKEIDALEASLKELEDMVSNIKKEKTQVEEILAVARRENNITSKCLDDVRNEMIILSSNVDTHVSVNKMLERKSSELEVGKHEQELHIYDLEVKNLQLSECVSGLEAQVRYLKDENESIRLGVEDYKSHIVDIKDEISLKQAEIEALGVERQKKLQEVQFFYSEASEESEVPNISYSKLQSTIESLIEECGLLQKQNGDLRVQKVEMSERMSHLEVQLRDLQNKNFGHLNKVNILEENLSLLHGDFTLMGETLAAQLESILLESKHHEKNLSEASVMLKHINQEKIVEVENLKLEIIHLSMQVCSFQDERERIVADAATEVSILRSDKNMLESNLQEIQFKVNMYESELHNLKVEYNNKVEGLENLLNASKQSEEMLMADIERMQRMTESLKSSEDTFRIMSNELELKLKASDYEKLQIIEDVSSLKIQLQKVTQFRNEILNLKTSLEEMKFEKEKLEFLLHSVSEECDGLKAEKISLSDKMSLMQRTLHGADDDRRNRIALEEKLLRLEAELAAKEASCLEEAGMKNGINRIEELAQSEEMLEEVLAKVESELIGSMEGPELTKEVALESKIHSLQTELAEALEANNIYQMKLNGYLAEEDSKAESSRNSMSENTTKADQSSKISSLESELREMRERYLHMSLQYAEVEANREELVMQLKSAKKEKKWFS